MDSVFFVDCPRGSGGLTARDEQDSKVIFIQIAQGGHRVEVAGVEGEGGGGEAQSRHVDNGPSTADCSVLRLSFQLDPICLTVEVT